MARTEEGVVTFARQLLLERIARAGKRIWLASPFISAPVASAICEAAAKSTAVERLLLTDLDERAVRSGVLDARALAELQGGDFKIASIANLHAKVSLVDSRWALVGSGNLTGAGLGGEEDGGNYEMGVLLGPAQRKLAGEVFVDWWEKAEPVSSEQIAWFSKLPPFPKKWNRRIGPTLRPPAEASLEEVLVEDPATAASRRYWVNANYHDPKDEMWWGRGWVSDGRRKSYSKGDLLVVYLGKKNKGPQRCPAVIRVVEVPRRMPEFVLRHRDPEAAERWPFVTKTETIGEVSPFAGTPLEVADKTPISVENGCELTRMEFEALARPLSVQSPSQ